MCSTTFLPLLIMMFTSTSTLSLTWTPVQISYMFIWPCEQGRIAAEAKNTEAFCLTLSGNPFDLSKLLNVQKKFRYQGGKGAALQAMKMGKLEEKQAKGSVKVHMPHKRPYIWNPRSDHCTLGRNYVFVLRNLSIFGNLRLLILVLWLL